ncbi:unnamed protein product [Brugia pahangi]|uniref:Transpos_assoc domain-containing protein n=1 Tax=Brugia pahangi TaxID=6280 RepID=A0A0N4U067_BRUPA|nr:unnamed protein product [Brugia pahangi]
MDVRLLAENCFNNLSSCINNSSDSVLYCLTIHEISWTSQVNRLVRCLSHSDFSLTLQNAEKLLREGSCSRRAMLNCDCSTCKPPSKFFRTHELEYQNDVTAQVASKSIKVAETSSMLMNLDYESAQQSEATAEERKLIESVKSQMTGKPEVETANIGHCGHYGPVLFSIISCVILFHICY